MTQHSSAYAWLQARLAAGGVLVLDGGTGTELQRRGVAMDPAAWCGPATLGNDQLLTQIHLDYINAGADVITANTFAAGRVMLAAAGYASQVEEINRRAVEAALKAREQAAANGRRVAVAGSISHMVPVEAGTDHIDPRLVPPDAQFSESVHEQAQHLRRAGVDHLMLEMMYHPGRIALVLEAVANCGLPVWFGLSARRGKDGSLVSFHHLSEIALAEIVALIPAAGIDAAGVMHSGSELVGDALNLIRSRFKGALTAYPDSGYFEMPDWKFVDVVEPARLEQFYAQWLAAGAQVIGGCCGLGVEHIEAAARARAAAPKTGATGVPASN